MIADIIYVWDVALLFMLNLNEWYRILSLYDMWLCSSCWTWMNDTGYYLCMICGFALHVKLEWMIPDIISVWYGYVSAIFVSLTWRMYENSDIIDTSMVVKWSSSCIVVWSTHRNQCLKYWLLICQVNNVLHSLLLSKVLKLYI